MNENITPQLHLGDLEEGLSQEHLENYFSKFGKIAKLEIKRDKNGFKIGFLAYFNPDDAETARKDANHKVILSKPIRVTKYRSQGQNSALDNVFIRLDKSIKIEEVDKELSKFGEIVSSKIPVGENGESRGIGYVQFETAEQAASCIQQSGKVFVNGKPLTMEHFHKDKGTNPATAEREPATLLITNFPKIPKEKTEIEYQEELKEELALKLRKYPIDSFIVKVDKQGEYFSFVVLRKHFEAERIINEFNNQQIFFQCAKDSKVLCVKLVVKNQSDRKISTVNENKIFIKNLKLTTTEEDLQKTFSQYGTVKCTINPNPLNDFGLSGSILFDSKTDAQIAFSNGKEKPEIRNLCVDGKVNIAPGIDKKTEFEKIIYNTLRDQQKTSTNLSEKNQQQLEIIEFYSEENLKASVITLQEIKNKMDEFLKLDELKQRQILGLRLLPKIKGIEKEMASKITNLLTDFSIFTVDDVIEFMEKEDNLREKIEEAKMLIENREANI